MRSLVVFIADNERIIRGVYEFDHNPPTIEDIEEAEESLQKSNNLMGRPILVNWMPLSESE